MCALKVGSNNITVRQIQVMLSNATNYFNGSWDSIFGCVTEQAVKRFQKENNLKVDGVVGQKTWNCLINKICEPKTKHFSLSEFKCKDGTDVPREYWGNVQYLMAYLELLRKVYNKPIKINSGYRTKQYNTKVGGAKNSQHLYANAADIVIDGVLPSVVFKTAQTYFKGCGKYSTFTHVDCRTGALTCWTG